MTLGLKRGTVALFPHEAAWEEEAARTIETLKRILGGAASDVQHVGSTAIRSIMAKPIVDIAVAVPSFDALTPYPDELRAHGFYYRPDRLEEQRLFACGSYYDGTGDMQTHFIHVVRENGAEWRDYLNFRDYMNAFPAAAKRYEALKTKLAEECPVDAGRTHYTAGKHGFIRQTLRKATVWSLLNKNVHIIIDRPAGYEHKKNGFSLVYPLNYGYIPGVPGGDGEELDVYLLGVGEPLTEADCRIVGAVHRKDDVEDKLIGAPAGARFTKEEMEAAVRFQEQWFNTAVIPAREAYRFEELYEETVKMTEGGFIS